MTVSTIINMETDLLKDSSVPNIDCPVCMENVTEFAQLCCGHSACILCLTNWFSEQIKEKQDPYCFNLKCGVKINLWELEAIVPKSMYDQYNQVLFERSIQESDDTIWCPKGCGNVISILNKHALRIECLKCKKLFCFQCKSEWHANQTCESYQKWMEENKQGPMLFQKYVKEQGAKRCPKCLVIVEKNAGCDHMTCKCRYQFNWVTGKVHGGGKEYPIPPEYHHQEETKHGSIKYTTVQKQINERLGRSFGARIRDSDRIAYDSYILQDSKDPGFPGSDLIEDIELDKVIRESLMHNKSISSTDNQIQEEKAQIPDERKEGEELDALSGVEHTFSLLPESLKRMFVLNKIKELNMEIDTLIIKPEDITDSLTRDDLLIQSKILNIKPKGSKQELIDKIREYWNYKKV